MVEIVDRTEFQNKIFDQLLIPEDQQPSIYKRFWVNQFNKNSLRLSKDGFVLLGRTLKIQYFTVNVKEGGEIYHGSLILDIDRTMTCPYYLDIFGVIYLFGSKEHTWLVLNDNSIRAFLNSWK